MKAAEIVVIYSNVNDVVILEFILRTREDSSNVLFIYYVRVMFW